MTEHLSADVKRHLARVFALVAACSLVAAGTCALLGALVSRPPYTYIVGVVGILGLIAVAIAFSRTPAKHSAKRFALLMAVCSFGGSFLVFFFTVVLSLEAWGLSAMLVMVSLSFASFSAAVMLPPQKKVTMYIVAFTFAIVALAVFNVVLSTVNIVLYSGALAATFLFAMFVIFSVYIAWKTEAIIRKVGEGDGDLIGDTASLFSDLFLSGVVGSCLSKPSDEEEPLLG